VVIKLIIAKMIENQSTIIYSNTEKKYRCSRGHEGTTNTYWTGLIDGLVINDQHFCVRCIVDFMKDKIGIVEEVN
jgi:hypothetical protein